MSRKQRKCSKKSDGKHHLPELLAPAGSLESFHAAIEGGADAIYLGLDTFNARMRAKNFTLKTLSYAAPYARAKKISVYVALNTLIKQAELPQLIDTINALHQIGIQAIIVQDAGLVHLTKSHFPNLPLHASTQMAIHNSEAAFAAGQLGIKRVILSRELSLEEISAIKRSVPAVELEIFVHGALCYSVSGLCLASSFLGGASGNRGRCTQVCRRAFASARGTGFFFSAKDLDASTLIGRILATGVSSLKIEGRMKSAEYVFTVVSAYRRLLDASHSSAAPSRFVEDSGRQKTRLFLGSPAQRAIINAASPAGAGQFLGRIKEVDMDRIRLHTNVTVAKGDRMRIHGERGFEGVSITAESVEMSHGDLIVYTGGAAEIKAGDWAYLTNRKKGSRPRWQSTRLPAAAARFTGRFSRTNRIIQSYRPSGPSTPPSRSTLTVRIHSPEWLCHIDPNACDTIEAAFAVNDMAALAKCPESLGVIQRKLRPVLPPFIPESELKSWRWIIRSLGQRGMRQWTCGHFSQSRLFDKTHSLYADFTIWTLNTAAQRLVLDHFRMFTYSVEDDLLNIRAASNPCGRVVLYGRMPAFISRVRPAVRLHDRFEDAHKERYFCLKHGGLYYTIAERPLCLTHRRHAFEKAGMCSFIIDLSFISPDSQTLETALEHYRARTRAPGTTAFNNKAGLK